MATQCAFTIIDMLPFIIIIKRIKLLILTFSPIPRNTCSSNEKEYEKGTGDDMSADFVKHLSR